jgi:hypothetical protein
MVSSLLPVEAFFRSKFVPFLFLLRRYQKFDSVIFQFNSLGKAIVAILNSDFDVFGFLGFNIKLLILEPIKNLIYAILYFFETLFMII